jgi:hypothetical protein
MRPPLSFALVAAALAAGLSAARSEPPALVEKPNAFPTLVNPNCSHCIDESKRRAGELRDDDRVLCWTRGKYDGGAIPFRFFLNPYRVISDTYGVFVHDPDAGFARGFAPSLDFRFHGWRNGVMVMKHADGTLYSCLSGVAFAGPRKGDRLTPFPTLVSDWGLWLKQYPATVAYHMYEKYRPVELPAKANPDAQRSRGPVDPRLAADRPVLGVADGKTALALPLDGGFWDRKKTLLPPQNAAEFRFAEQPCVVLSDAPSRTVMAYRQAAERRAATDKLGEQGELLESKAVEVHADGGPAAAPFVDRKSGTRFDVAGRGTDGPLKGWTLAPLDAVVVKWWAWAAEYPDTAIHGK